MNALPLEVHKPNFMRLHEEMVILFLEVGYLSEIYITFFHPVILIFI